MLRAGIGSRWKLGRTCALFMEAEYEHVSNADTASRNVGMNAIGGTIDFSHFF